MMIATLSKKARILAPAAFVALLVVGAFQGCKLATYESKVLSVIVTPANPCIAATTSQQFTVQATYSDGSDPKDVTADAAWTSSTPSVATVGSGLATAVGAGTTTITASIGGVSGTATLVVTEGTLLSIDVATETPTIANGTRAQFSATGHYDGGCSQDLTSQVTWSSSDDSVTVSNAAGSNGLATSTALGATTSTITATLETISGFTTLHVNAVTLTSISVTPATATIKVAKAQQFEARGTFSDGTTQVMTNEVTWTSSDTSTATVSSTGLATGKLAGSTTITAMSSALLGSVSGTAQLTVQTAGGGY